MASSPDVQVGHAAKAPGEDQVLDLRLPEPDLQHVGVHADELLWGEPFAGDCFAVGHRLPGRTGREGDRARPHRTEPTEKGPARNAGAGTGWTTGQCAADCVVFSHGHASSLTSYFVAPLGRQTHPKPRKKTPQ